MQQGQKRQQPKRTMAISTIFYTYIYISLSIISLYLSIYIYILHLWQSDCRMASPLNVFQLPAPKLNPVVLCGMSAIQQDDAPPRQLEELKFAFSSQKFNSLDNSIAAPLDIWNRGNQRELQPSSLVKPPSFRTKSYTWHKSAHRSTTALISCACHEK